MSIWLFRLLLSLFLILALVLSLLHPSSPNSPPVRASTDRPNIILIFTDDMDAEVIRFMPHLKSLLSDEGTTFANFFTSTSVCCPSRATILRGQYAHNHQVLSNSPPAGGFQKFRDQQLESATIATWLQAAGYHTALIGKYFNGYPDGDMTYIPAGWNEWYSRVDKEKRPSEDGPTNYYRYKMNENRQIVSYGDRPEDYLTDVQARKTAEFLQHAAQSSKPFFLYLSLNAPHTPLVAAPRHENALADLRAPRTPSFNEGDVSDKPSPIRNLPQLTKAEMKKLDLAYRKRAQMLLAVDELIEGLFAQLSASGELDNTYIFFTSDNGYHLGQHRLKNGKGTQYEEDIRVPLIVRGPGITANRSVTELAGLVDLAPTFIELAGAPIPELVDGRSLLPLLQGASVGNWRKVFLLESFVTDIPRKGLRTKDSSYVEYNNGEREFYDLKRDPFQVNNSFSSADRQLIDALAARLAALSTCKGAGCRQAEER